MHRVEIGCLQRRKAGLIGLCDMHRKRTDTGRGQDKGEIPFSCSLAGEDRHLKYEASGFETRMSSIGHRLKDPHTRTCCESNLSSLISGLTKFLLGSVILEIKVSDGQQETYRTP